MANWCNNIVQFTGEPQKLEELDGLFKAMGILEEQTRHGQLPSFLQSDQGYCFDIYTEEETIYYNTKWVPNTDILVQVADHYQVGFTHQYSELGMWIFGRASYEQSVLNDIRLDNGDFELHKPDEQGLYQFNGRFYETEIEFLEDLLEWKKDHLDNSQGYKR